MFACLGFLPSRHTTPLADPFCPQCWQSWNRSSTGELIANSSNFPSGMPALVDYVHSKGLCVTPLFVLASETQVLAGAVGAARLNSCAPVGIENSVSTRPAAT